VKFDILSPEYLTSSNLDSAALHLSGKRVSEACWVLRNASQNERHDRNVYSLLSQCHDDLGDMVAVAAYRNKAESKNFSDNSSRYRNLPLSGIFVGGTGRSGTSLLRRLLNTNPAIASVPGETKCINDESFRLAPHWFHSQPVEERPRALQILKSLWLERFYCYVHSHKASPHDDLFRGFCLWLEKASLEKELSRLDALLEATSLREIEIVWGRLYASLFDYSCKEKGKEYWVEKTPRNSFYADYLYSILPGMKLINIVRDGRDVALSMHNVLWGQKDYIKALDWWAEEIEQTERVLESLPDHAALTVRYEDLVTDPEVTMGHIAEFLGVTPAYDLDIFASSVGRWKSSLPPVAQEHAISSYGSLFERYGYELEVRKSDIIQMAIDLPSGFDMKKRNDGVRYMADLVLPLRSSLECTLMKDIAAEGEACFFLRHDVDDNINAAMQMAMLENENGIQSSYFLMPPSPAQGGANYYGTLKDNIIVPHPDLIEHAKRLQDWGHEVGLHNNIAELAIYLKRNIADLLHEQLDYFRSNGIAIHGTAAHGSPFFHDNMFISYEIFAQAGVKPGLERGRVVQLGDVTLQLHSLDMSDFGLSYEAYSLPFDIGINDSNCQWGGGFVRRSKHPDLNSLTGERHVSAFQEVIASADNLGGKQKLHVLTHPEHWELS